jgi:hypothetical protein
MVAVPIFPPYAIVVEADPAAPDAASWRDVVDLLAAHRHAVIVPMAQGALDDALARLREIQPEFVAFVVPPARIDDTFVGEVFEGMTKLDGDPFLDGAHGFVTGRTAEDAMSLVRNTIRAEAHAEAIRRKFTGIAHTFAQADLGPFATEQGAMFKALGYETAAIVGIDGSDDWTRSRAEEVAKLNGSSIVFCAGHGMGDWMCAIDGRLLRGLALDAAIVVNGTCHSATTTTRHDIDPATMGVVTRAIDPADSIALNFIAAGAVAQYGSTASSSWMNVGLAIGGFLHEGRTMGEALRDRLNDHLASHAVRAVEVLPFEDGKPSPQFLGAGEDPASVQSIARVVLLGDPAYRPFPVPLARAVAPPADAETTEQLIAELDDPNAPRFAALNRLIARGADAVEPLARAMETSSNWQIPKALGAIGDDRATNPLIEKLAGQPPSPMREVVIEALQLITGEDFGADAGKWRAWRKRSVLR